MQNYDSTQLEIEHLLVELSCCVNDLQHFHQQLSVDDIKQAQLSLPRLETLISSGQSGYFKLIAV